MKWQPVGGAVEQLALQPPVTLLAELGLVFAKGGATNLCTGQVVSSTVGPDLYPVVVLAGKPTASVWLSPDLGWSVHIAWLRVYEDASGQRGVQWLQPVSGPGGPSQHCRNVSVSVGGGDAADGGRQVV